MLRRIAEQHDASPSGGINMTSRWVNRASPKRESLTCATAGKFEVHCLSTAGERELGAGNVSLAVCEGESFWLGPEGVAAIFPRCAAPPIPPG